MINYDLVSGEQVREYIGVTGAGGSARTSVGNIGSNVRASVYWLERRCRRFFADRPAGTTYKFTTDGNANVYLPGLREASTVALSGTALVEDDGYWLRPDEQQSGIFTGIQVRAYRSRGDGLWYLSHSDWFDRNLDSPWHPANRVGGESALPNDLVITGAWGYEAGSEPPPLLHVVKVFAGWMTQRGLTLLGGVAVDPSGNAVDYSKWPVEITGFVEEFGIGQQAELVG